MNAAPAGAVRAQIAQPQMGPQQPSAMPANKCRRRDRAAAGRHCVVGRADERDGFAGAGCVACGQWSLGSPIRATLVRHFIGFAHLARLTQRASPLTPACRASSVLELTAPTALVALGGLAPALAATHAGARPAAILLAAIAMGTKQHLVAAPRAQEQAGRTVHVHLGRQAKGCWTDSSQGATLLLHRLHRHGVGRGAVPKLAGVRDRCRAHLLRHHRRCTAGARPCHGPCCRRPTGWPRAGRTPSKRSPSPAWPPSGSHAGEPHARLFGISKPRTNASPNQKTRPRRHLNAVPDRHSHLRRITQKSLQLALRALFVARAAPQITLARVTLEIDRLV